MRRLHGKNYEKYGRPEIVSFPQIMTAVYGFGASSSEVNQCSQHLTILTISWSMVGELPPSPPGDYYLQTQISVPKPKPTLPHPPHIVNAKFHENRLTLRPLEYKRVYLPLFIWFQDTRVNPLTACAAYIRFFISYQHIQYNILNMLKIKCDIYQQDLKRVDLHFVKSE